MDFTADLKRIDVPMLILHGDDDQIWPGNIRELQNVVERSVIVCETANFSVDERWLRRSAEHFGKRRTHDTDIARTNR